MLTRKCHAKINTKGIISAAAIVVITASLIVMSVPQQKAYAYTGYDKYFYMVGIAEGKQHAYDDYNNDCRFCNQWADDPAPCESGDYRCLEIFGWRIGYFDEWCALTGECLAYNTHVD